MEAEKPNEEEPTPEEVPVEEEPTPLEEPPTPKPKTVRIRKPPKAAAAAPSIVMPEIDDKFWATLLRTQREAERATKLQRISEFNLV